MPKVFISHTHSDKEIADALNEAIVSLFGKAVIEVVYSTKKEGSGAVPHGADWFRWIVKQVTDADVAFVLLTPASIQKPWILWEAGAVEGAAMAGEAAGAGDGGKLRKARPLVYKLRPSEIPSPFHRTQAMRGDLREDAKRFLKELIEQFKGTLDEMSLVGVGERLTPTVDAYLASVAKAMRRAPLLVNEAAVQEWLSRLERFQKRPSEVEQIHNWIKLAFGREEKEMVFGREETEDRPLDLRLHRRLAELYSRAGTPGSRILAARELELARLLSPRDIYILREQGRAYIGSKDYDEAWRVIEEIEALDPKAFRRDAECAALKGKWFRRTDAPAEAVKVYVAALPHNPDSYYLLNLAAEASLESEDREQASEYYKRSLRIIEKLRESNIWAWASAVNACLALSREEKARNWCEKIAGEDPSKEEFDAIESGFRLVEMHYELEAATIDALIDILRGGGSE